MRRLLFALLLPACGGGSGAPDARIIDSGGGGLNDGPGLDAPAPDAQFLIDANPGALPDLTPVANLMDGTSSFDFINVSINDPVYVEGCVGGTGTRRVLRFDAVTANLGDADFYIGPPNSSNPLFEWSPAHGHYHVKDYATYTLIASDDSTVTGHKQAFCLLDSTQITPGATPHYTCSNQGISVGYADTYGAYLDCQWIDVTGVAAGEYRLRVDINPTHLLEEMNYDNNRYEALVTL